jgi:RNA polymerase sigma-70 factor (ECF subfamily)
VGQDRKPDEQRTAALMIRYQSGDLQAFEELYGWLKPRLFRYILSRVMDRGRGEDLLQEVFLQIHRSRRTFLPGNPLLAWAFGVARHVCLMDLRQRRRRAAHEILADDFLPELAVSSEAESFADRQVLAKALGLLPEDSREALVLHQLEGLSFKEIAGILGISVQAARVRAHRAAKALADSVGKLNPTKPAERQNPLKREPSQGDAT